MEKEEGILLGKDAAQGMFIASTTLTNLLLIPWKLLQYECQQTTSGQTVVVVKLRLLRTKVAMV